MANIPGVQKSAPAQAVAVTGKGSVKKGTKNTPAGTDHPTTGAMGSGSTGPININQTGYDQQQES